ncbi:hypothetical protein [Streptomyces lydicus]|uniref:hypothetical protein n=1 Tax=Streptomyces lydicus TaxID=47763 RepID=UPI0036E3BCE9
MTTYEFSEVTPLGTHSMPAAGKMRTALAWLTKHRRKVYAVVVVLLPLVARYVPGFPADEILSVVRGILGA